MQNTLYKEWLFVIRFDLKLRTAPDRSHISYSFLLGCVSLKLCRAHQIENRGGALFCS
jgi:hypothetical protein